MWTLADIFNGKLYFTYDITDDEAVPSICRDQSPSPSGAQAQGQSLAPNGIWSHTPGSVPDFFNGLSKCAWSCSTTTPLLNGASCLKMLTNDHSLVMR